MVLVLMVWSIGWRLLLAYWFGLVCDVSAAKDDDNDDDDVADVFSYALIDDNNDCCPF